MSQGPNAFIPPAFTPPTAPQAVMLETDLACRKCGYNLRGLSSDGRCPECGAAVGLSIRGDLLRYAEPKWVRKLQRGVKMILNGIAVIIIGMIIMMIMSAMRIAAPWAAQLVMWVGSILMVIGAWQLTEPDPSGIGEDKYGTSRKIIRFAQVVSVVNMALQVIPQIGFVSPPVFWTVTVVGAAAGLIGLIGQFAQLNYLAKLAMRIPDDKLAQRARFLMWAIGISYGLIIVMGIILGFAAASMGGRGGGPPTALMVFGCFMAIAALALLVFAVMYLRLLDRLRKRFDEEATTAERTWARPDAAPVPAM